MRRLSTKTFIERAAQVHANTYDYSLVKYVKANAKITIVCLIHGSFEQLAANHLYGKDGCPKCGILSQSIKNRQSTELFIKAANHRHNNQYDYINVVYSINTKPVVIGCKRHGDFMQSPASHLAGKGCRKCTSKGSDNAKIGAAKKILECDQRFINRANEIHNHRYEYLSPYRGVDQRIDIACKQHGTFSLKVKEHLRGKGCPLCKRDLMQCQTKLYLIEIQSAYGTFIKIGCTIFTVKKRFAKAIKAGLTINSMAEVALVGKLAYQWENKILHKFKEFRIVPKWFTDGRTECFLPECKDEIIALLSGINQ